MGRGSGIRRVSPRLTLAGLTVLMATAVLGALAPAGKAYIYWTDNGPGFSGGGTTLARANNDGRGLKASLIKNASSPGGIVVHGKYIYWANIDTNSIGRASINGTGANPKFISAGESVVYLGIDSNYIYWAGSSGGLISRARLDGSDINKTCIDAGTAPTSLTVSGGMIYIGELQQINRVPAQCGNTHPTTFVTLSRSQASPTALAVAGGYLYWSEFDLSDPPPASSIGRAALSDPSSPDESFVPSLVAPSGVAVYGGYLYWVDHEGGPGGNGAIGREPLASQNPNYDFISDARGPGEIVVDGLIDPTTTSVTCSPARVPKSNPTVCTAVVHDSASSELPSGSVVFSAAAGTFFPGGNSCTLSKRPTGGVACSVGAESATIGKHAVTAAYRGNATHRPSSGHATFCAGTKSECK